jgi:hypothetical protein
MDRATFIQWKNTDLCMDFWCPECDNHSHFDGYLAYQIQCPYCGAIWRLGDSVTIEPGSDSDVCLQTIPDRARPKNPATPSPEHVED